MNMETIREWLNRRPFAAFVLRLSNGEAYDVRHPENVALGRNRIAISFPETDRFAHVLVVHINTIEGLQTA
jgi:hypothetical protein